ncbi:Aste57867_15648 [Aphanomyces stellatus]|uniref:Aste57867_15648 protein n=1 Tax=Aphanomyces stellatus TaxID=120398 RepID=A0A485L6K6_9STRA|nr:hypothetical protein As57867_015592 [Aphanomyces stellatus]VFT92444.1 Aste57867_15648 [Aphanomyces stellatus]
MTWVRHLDEDSTRFYYYNQVTGETTWTEPEGYTGEGSKDKAGEDDNKDDAPAAKRARVVEADDDGTMWVKYVDPTTKRPYYSDMNSGRTTWEQPTFYTSDQGEDDDEEDEEALEEEYTFGAVTDKASTSGTDDTKLAAATTASETTPDFLRYIEPTTNTPYYFNTKTQATQWDAPPEDAVVHDAPTTASTAQETVTGSAKYQEWLNKATHAPAAKTASVAANAADPVHRLNSILGGGGGTSETFRWQQHYDTKTQRYYYYDTETGETQWEPPAEGAAISAGGADWVPADVPSAVEPVKEQNEYTMIAQMNLLNGRFTGSNLAAGGATAGGADYFHRAGIPADKAGRQLSNFFDLTAFEANRAEAKRIKEELKKKNIDWRKYNDEKKRKRHRIRNKWMYED